MTRHRRQETPKSQPGPPQFRNRARRRALTVTAAALTATAMTLSPITPGPKAEGASDVYTFSAGMITGPLFEMVQTIYGIPVLGDLIPPAQLPIIGNVDVPGLLGLFSWKYPLPYPRGIADGQLALQDGDFIGTNIIVGLMDGAMATGQAMTMIQNDIVPEPGVNHYYYVLVRNPGRANGGIASRFDWLYSFFGLSPVGSAVSGNASAKVHSDGVNTGFYDSLKLDVGFGYDSMTDFPASPLALVSIVNSVVQSFLPTNYFGPTEAKTLSLGSLNTGMNVYVTVVPTQAALLEPLRLPGRMLDAIGVSIPVISQLANLQANIADALEPAMDILINVGYNDVDLSTYQRSFQDFNSNAQFLIDSTLDPSDYITAVGAALDAAVKGVQGLLSGGLTGLFASHTSAGHSSSQAAVSAAATVESAAAAQPYVSPTESATEQNAPDVARPLSTEPRPLTSVPAVARTQTSTRGRDDRTDHATRVQAHPDFGDDNAGGKTDVDSEADATAGTTRDATSAATSTTRTVESRPITPSGGASAACANRGGDAATTAENVADDTDPAVSRVAVAGSPAS